MLFIIFGKLVARFKKVLSFLLVSDLMGDDKMGDSEESNSSSCGCRCGGCLGVLVLGTAIVGTIVAGGVKDAFYKVKSTWDYDNQVQIAQSIADKDHDGVVTDKEWVDTYRDMGGVTIEGKVPTQMDVPYKVLKEYNDNYGHSRPVLR